MGDSLGLGTPRSSSATLSDTAQNAAGSGRTSTASISDTFTTTVIVIGTLANTDVQPQSLVTGAVGNVDVSFKLDNTLPKDGKIVITLPGGYTISSGAITALVSDNFDGGASVSISGQVITITRDGTGTDVSADTSVTLQLSNIKNPTDTGSTGTYAIKTTNSSGAAIDQDLSVAADTIIAEATTMTTTEEVTTVSIVRSADLAIAKRGTPRSTTVGNNVTYTLTVTNNGPDNATGVTLSDTLPAGATHVSSSSSLGTCSGTTTVTCELGTLGPLQAATVTIIVTLNEVGTVANSARVSGDRDDPVSANNTSRVTTSVSSPITVALTYAPDRTVRAGATLVITATFSGSVTGTPTIAIDTPGTDLSPRSMTASNDGAVRTFRYTVPSGSDGTARVTIAGATDAAGHLSEAATNNTFTIDSTPASFAGDDIVGTTVQDGGDTIVLTFSESVRAADGTFSANELTSMESPDGTSLSFANASFSLSSDGTALTITLDEETDESFLTNGEPITVALAANTVTDLAGNTLPGGEVTGTTASAGDTSGPTLSVGDVVGTTVQDGGDTITLTFSEAIRAADGTLSLNEFTSIESPSGTTLNLTNATFSLSSDGKVLTITLDEATDGSFIKNGESISVNLAPNAITDLAGNPLPGGVIGGTTANTGDTTPPTVELTYEFSRDEVLGNIVTITATFSELMERTPAISVGAPGAASALGRMTDSGDRTVWTYTYVVAPGVSGTATVTIEGTDLAGNPNLPATNNTFVIDIQGPAVALTYEPDRAVRAGETVVITATFSQAVTGTPSLSINTSGVDLSPTAMVDSGDRTVWTLSYVVPEDSDGTAVVTITGASDEAGNPSQQPINNTFTIDTVGPTVALSYEPDRPVGAGQTVLITATFSEPVSGTLTIAIDTGGIDLDPVAMTDSGDGTVWTFSYTVPEGSEGPAKVTIAGAKDEAGNSNQQATNDTFTIADLTADLAVSFGDSPAEAPRGGILIYSVTVTNSGPADAFGVTITDTLPVGVTFVSAVPGSPTCTKSAGTVTCELDDLASGDSVGVTIEVAVLPTATGTLSNTACAAADQPDPDPSNNCGTGAETTVQIGELTYTVTIGAGELDSVDVTLADSPDPVFVGGNLTYTLDVTNGGDGVVTDVTLTVTLPASVAFASARAVILRQEPSASLSFDFPLSEPQLSASLTVPVRALGMASTMARLPSLIYDPGEQAGIQEPLLIPARAALSAELTQIVSVAPAPTPRLGLAQPIEGECIEEAGTVVCNLGDLPGQERASVAIIVETMVPRVLNNSAKVTYEEMDPSAATPRAAESTLVVSAADLALTAAQLPSFILAGSNFEYVFTVSNNGPSDVSGVTVTDTLPPGVAFDPASASLATCQEQNGVVTCSLDILAEGDSVTFSIPVTVGTSVVGAITNTAQVAGKVADLDTSNNAVTQSIAIDLEADLSVTIALASGNVVGGNKGDYILTVTNNGPSDATSVNLTNSLPQEVDFISVEPGFPSCNESDGIVACSLDRFASGDSVTAIISVLVASSAVGTITNTASVVGHEADLAMQNNTATESASIKRVADLSLTKIYSPELAPEVNHLAYILNVTNNGPSDATDVTITDTLSEGVSFVSFSGDAQECTETGGNVTCELGSLPSRGSATVIIVVAPASEGTITNTATATANENDPNAGNDSSVSVAATFRFVADVPGPTPTAEAVAPAATPVPTPMTGSTPAPPETAPTPVGPLADEDDSTLLVIILVLGSLAATIIALLLYHNRLILAGRRRRKRMEEEEEP